MSIRRACRFSEIHTLKLVRVPYLNWPIVWPNDASIGDIIDIHKVWTVFYFCTIVLHINLVTTWNMIKICNYELALILFFVYFGIYLWRLHGQYESMNKWKLINIRLMTMSYFAWIKEGLPFSLGWNGTSNLLSSTFLASAGSVMADGVRIEAVIIPGPARLVSA